MINCFISSEQYFCFIYNLYLVTLISYWDIVSVRSYLHFWGIWVHHIEILSVSGATYTSGGSEFTTLWYCQCQELLTLLGDLSSPHCDIVSVRSYLHFWGIWVHHIEILSVSGATYTSGGSEFTTLIYCKCQELLTLLGDLSSPHCDIVSVRSYLHFWGIWVHHIEILSVSGATYTSGGSEFTTLRYCQCQELLTLLGDLSSPHWDIVSVRSYLHFWGIWVHHIVILSVSGATYTSGGSEFTTLRCCQCQELLTLLGDLSSPHWDIASVRSYLQFWGIWVPHIEILSVSGATYTSGGSEFTTLRYCQCQELLTLLGDLSSPHCDIVSVRSYLHFWGIWVHHIVILSVSGATYTSGGSEFTTLRYCQCQELLTILGDLSSPHWDIVSVRSYLHFWGIWVHHIEILSVSGATYNSGGSEFTTLRYCQCQELLTILGDLSSPHWDIVSVRSYLQFWGIWVHHIVILSVSGATYTSGGSEFTTLRYCQCQELLTILGDLSSPHWDIVSVRSYLHFWGIWVHHIEILSVSGATYTSGGSEFTTLRYCQCQELLTLLGDLSSPHCDIVSVRSYLHFWGIWVHHIEILSVSGATYTSGDLSSPHWDIVSVRSYLHFWGIWVHHIVILSVSGATYTSGGSEFTF